MLALLLGASSFSFRNRRQAAPPTPAPVPIRITIIILDAASLALVANAIWSASHYATGVYPRGSRKDVLRWQPGPPKAGNN